MWTDFLPTVTVFLLFFACFALAARPTTSLPWSVSVTDRVE
jgi:hypothetical protein